MKLSILQENFSKGLITASRSVASKPSLPILANILLETEKGQLKLSATNLETGINLWLGAKIEKEGKITIPAKILTEFISSLPPGKIDLEVRQTNLFVSSGLFKASFAGASASEFPKIPTFEEKPILVFKKEFFSPALSQVAFAAASDEGRPVLTGVLLKKEKETISLIATDGYRLSVKKAKATTMNLEDNLLIPAKTLLEVSRIIQEEKGDEKEVKIALSKEKSQVVFALNQIEISSRLIEGEFPDFEKIIPKETTIQAVFDKEEFLRGVKIASIFAREQANIVKLKIEKGNLKISAEMSQIGENESQVEAKTKGEPLEIAFNCRFLLDFLNSCSQEEIVFESSGALNPGVFKGVEDDSFLHIIMPVRLQT